MREEQIQEAPVKVLLVGVDVGEEPDFERSMEELASLAEAAEKEVAGELASLTKGYPFAFQVLGYLYWENRDKKTLEQILPEYDQYLDEYVYSKIWSELSDLDKKIVTEMSLSGETQVKALRERLDMKSELFSVYRERLKRKGVIISKEYGKVTLALPRFDEFVKIQQLM